MQELFSCLLDGVVVDLHLFWEVFFQPLILVYPIHDEEEGALTGDLHAGLPVFPVVEPGLRPPTDTCLVGIDADDSRDIETLDYDVQVLQWIDDAAVRYGLVIGFFFNPSSQVDRNVPCSIAR